MKAEFDVVVIGSGISGLTCGVYLQKAGASVAVVERLDECGPHCMTVEPMEPGAPLNTHVVMGLTSQSPCIEDLELERFGFKMVFAPTQYGATFKDGKNVLIYHDPQKTAQSFEKHSRRDAQTYLEIMCKVLPGAVPLHELMLFSVPSPENLERIWEIGPKYLGINSEDFRTMNGFELLDTLFEDEHIKQTFMGPSEIGIGGDPTVKGEGAVNCFLVMYLAQGLFKGGSHNLVHALVRCFKHYGGALIYNSAVEKIIVEERVARGVILAEDALYHEREIRAKKAVVSNLSAPLTLKLIGEDKVRTVDPHLASKMKYWAMDGVSPFVSCYLLKTLPKWKSEEFDAGIKSCWEPYRAWDSWEHAKQTFGYYKNEEIWKLVGAVGEIVVSAATDETQFSPLGHCTLVFEQELPCHLRREGGFEKWDEIKWKISDIHTEVLEELAPGFKDIILDRQVYTPLDIWRKNPSAVYGAEFGGDCSGDQWYLGRMPYRMPIANLYMSNSVWPIGATFLGQAYNAACVIAEDLGIRKQPWWIHKPLAWYLKQVGLSI